MTQAIREDLKEQLAQQREWEQMTPAQKKTKLFLRQKELLATFLSHHAISQAQYDEGMAALQSAG